MENESGVNFYLKDGDFEEPPEDIYYLLAATGLFKVTKTFAFTASTISFSPCRGKELSSLDKHEESLDLHLPKKVPYKIFLDCFGFFREIYKRRKSESGALLYWSEQKKEYILTIPEQKTKGRWRLEMDIGPIPEGSDYRLGTIHSHGDLRASHSEIDDADEEHDDGLHITLGDMTGFPSISCSVVVDGSRFMVRPADVFEFEPLKMPLVPEEWIKKVK